MITIVLPAYNEAKNLKKCVMELRKRLKGSYEIIIAEDGSTDGTDEIGASLARTSKRIRFIHSDKKLGRGLALKRAFKIAKGDSIGYIDVDMATHMQYIDDLLRYAEDFDVVTGSRYVRGADVNRPFLRDFVSRVYNFMIRFFIGAGIYDSQCGFKMFSRGFVKKEILGIKEKTWAWDTIVLVQGIKKGYSYMEFPVRWKEAKDPRHSSSFSRIFRDTFIHGRAIWRLFLRWRLGMGIEL